jgi:hypothetical protein
VTLSVQHGPGVCEYCGDAGGAHKSESCPIVSSEPKKHMDVWEQGRHDGVAGKSNLFPNSPYYVQGWIRGVEKRANHAA